MKFAYYDNYGNITSICDYSLGELPAAGEHGNVFAGDCAFEDLIDPVAGTLIRGGKGQAPSPFHKWDIPTVSWKLDLGAAKAAKSTAIERERERRIASPIVYDGLNIDSDSIAQRNINNKISSIDRRVQMGMAIDPAELVWRDADNQMHSFADVATYSDWLKRLMVAMEERGTTAYAWSWNKKAQVEAATTEADVNAVDLST